jgi:hypothetical protein
MFKIHLFSPPPKEEISSPSSLVNDNDTTINLAQIERVNSMSMIEFDHSAFFCLNERDFV